MFYIGLKFWKDGTVTYRYLFKKNCLVCQSVRHICKVPLNKAVRFTPV